MAIMVDPSTVRRLALNLPEVEAGDGDDSLSFSVGGKGLAWPYLARATPKGRREVVPGVGHFSAASYFDDGWRREIRAAVADGVPLLGICLGLQWLFEGSEEAPLPGLGALAGQSNGDGLIGPSSSTSCQKSLAYCVSGMPIFSAAWW